MKQLNISFQLGMEYENWEFELEPIEDRIKGNDSYLYVGKELNYFMNYSTDRTELIFNMDILSGVVLTFVNIEVKDFKQFCDRIEKCFVMPKISKFSPLFTNSTFKLRYKNMDIWGIYSLI